MKACVFCAVLMGALECSCWVEHVPACRGYGRFQGNPGGAYAQTDKGVVYQP